MSYSTDHYSSESMSSFPELANRRDLRAFKFKPMEGTCQMVYISPNYPKLKYVRFCDDIESTSSPLVLDDLFYLVDSESLDDKTSDENLEP